MRYAAATLVIPVLLLVGVSPGGQSTTRIGAGTPSGPSAPSSHSPYVPLAYVESSTGLGNPQWEGGGTELELGDVNADGKVDIVAIGDHGSPYVNTQEHGIMVYFGNGAGAWSVFQSGNFGYGGIALGDVNGDGWMDAGYGMHHNWSSTDFGDQLIEVALGDGTGTGWTPWDDGLATNGESWGMFGTDFADYDGDGDLDLGANSFGASAGVHLYRNEGDGTWTQTFGFTGGNSSFDLVFGDVNGDGHADFVAENSSGTVYLGNGLGGFTLADLNLPSPGAWGVRDGLDLGDVDGDGCDDVAWVGSGGEVEVWRWDPAGQWLPAKSGLPVTSPAEAAQLGDMDGDGRTDLVLFGGGIGAVFLGDGAGHWAVAAYFAAGTPGYCSALETGDDADRNGRPDIVLVSEEGSLFSTRNHLRCYLESSVPAHLAVRLVRPGPHAVLRRGQVRFLEWRSAVPGGVPATIDLELSTSGPGGPWTPIAAGLPDNGRHQWTVPPSTLQTAAGHLRVTLRTAGQTVAHVNAVAFSIE
ncbi:MAG: VCBS repeat-containing protein [Planctomycetota bacterium]